MTEDLKLKISDTYKERKDFKMYVFLLSKKPLNMQMKETVVKIRAVRARKTDWSGIPNKTAEVKTRGILESSGVPTVKQEVHQLSVGVAWQPVVEEELERQCEERICIAELNNLSF